MTPPVALVGGSLIFLIFLVVFLLAVAFGYYTVKGSGISLTPYRRSDGPPEAPSEIAHDRTQDVRNWDRGTADHHQRHRPAPSHEPQDPAVAAALRRWRAASATEPHLQPPVGPKERVRGPAAAITVTIYLDLASEPCRSAWRLLTALARRRHLRLAVRHLPLADVHKLSLPAAEALEAARAQGRFFALLDRLARDGLSAERTLLELASSLVDDPLQLQQEVRDGRHRAQVAVHIDQAMASGAHAIPALYIDGARYDGMLFEDALSRALAARAASTPLLRAANRLHQERDDAESPGS